MLITIVILAILCTPTLWCILGRPRFLAAPAHPLPESTVSIIIPARNEAINIGALLESILPWPHEVIVVDDDSTDGTAAIARQHGATVISPPALPSDWKGKPWACHHGAAAATGDWLLFLDADTRFAPGGLEKFTALTTRSDCVHSVCPHHTVRHPSEQLSAFFNVMMLAGVNAFGFQRDPSRHAALFGQSLLISQTHYRQVGGHAPVRAEILENFHLSRHLADLNIPRECYMGRGTITMRMYPGGFPDLWNGWKKGFTSGAGSTAPRALFLSSVWITGAMFSIVAIALAFTPSAPALGRGAAFAAYFLYALQCFRTFRLAGTFSPLNALLYPIGLLFYQTLFFTALVQRRLGIMSIWKDRHVD